ncbi:hypothetical protein LGK95_08875 [Clostridium algoriphilum]|uniref:hypothetical protein n=1 Tax=Clostridium algoriphilum TaxID=198347 RepID=UPI001CF10C3A|nr:hypothetical protein [Clostridium algoriphilum]MCB2293635.1 hypothetical protein [Clostridium algoriphilum]
MNDKNKKLLEVENVENISEMILKFRQCADTAADLSNSVGKFTDIYLNVEKNVTKLEGIERNLNSNDYIKGLLVVTDNMKDIFNYFNDNIPQLLKSLQSSKQQLDLHKDELGVVLNNFNDLPHQMDNAIKKVNFMLNDYSINNKNILDELQGYVEDQNKRIKSNNIVKKTMLDEFNKQLNTGLMDFQKVTLKLINDSVNKSINDKNQFLINKFDDISNNLVESITRYNTLGETDTIYNLYIAKGRNLPIDVKRISWTGDFYFKVERIGQRLVGEHFSLIAYGKRLKDKSYYDTFEIGTDLKQFKLYNDLTPTSIEEGDISI